MTYEPVLLCRCGALSTDHEPRVNIAGDLVGRSLVSACESFEAA